MGTTGKTPSNAGGHELALVLYPDWPTRNPLIDFLAFRLSNLVEVSVHLPPMVAKILELFHLDWLVLPSSKDEKGHERSWGRGLPE